MNDSGAGELITIRWAVFKTGTRIDRRPSIRKIAAVLLQYHDDLYLVESIAVTR